MPKIPEPNPLATLTPRLRPLAARLTALEGLLGTLVPVPEGAATGRSRGSSGSTSEELRATPCSSYGTLIAAWREALSWTDGLDCALSVMLSSILSTKAVGDQLWVKIIGPAACGKSTLCEAVSVSKRYVAAKSTIRGFHSGFKTDGEGAEDNSLIATLTNRTLVTKDGDTLLQAPNRAQILSEARDIYDRVSRTHYRNKMGKDYEGLNMTWILCGTASLRTIDNSELGQRFLDCVIMDGIDPVMEDEVLLRVAARASTDLTIEANGSAETQYDPKMAKAMQLTGGYVEHLRENAVDLLSTVRIDSKVQIDCACLGKFVAYARARPSNFQDESAEREFAARLVSQHVRLATCLAVVLGKRTADGEVMRRVAKVSFDTGRGTVLDIIRYLYSKPNGVLPNALSMEIGVSQERAKGLLRFLTRIKATQSFSPEASVRGVSHNRRWRLTDGIRELYTRVLSIGKDGE